MAENEKDKPETKAAPAPTTVEYVGAADLRSISKAEWEQAGVTNQDDVAWNATNGFKVKASALSPEALEIISRDPGFKLTA